LAPGAGLTALTDVRLADGEWEASGAEAWLRCDVPPSAGRWLRLEYSAGLTDPLTRPVLRFVGGSGAHDEFLPAAMLGKAVWIGQAPEDVREIWISPTLGPGRFAFRIERWDILSPPQALAQFGSAGIGRAAKYLWGQWNGWERFARLQARRALGPTPLAHYASWRRARERPFEAQFDSGRLASAPARFLILAPDAAAAQALQPMLSHQIWPHWSLGVAGERRELGVDEYVLALRAGDRLEPYALATLAAHADRDGQPDAIYADEDALAGRTRSAPRLKPDWSPLFAKSGYLGAPLALRGAAWKAGGLDAATARVSHARRVLLSRSEPEPALPAPPAAIDIRRQATIIVPTRDRLDLIGSCVESLFRYPAGADFELVVIDNGSESAEALAFLKTLEGSPNSRVLRRPGPFNFSAICNEGARAARHPFLLFLNNDVRALAPDWLGRMLAFAAAPGVGAVGAKLLFPDGRLQHGGVVLGLDGFAGHVQRAVGADDPGYLGMLAWPREVAAVTGACMAVEARKFFEVGGFDEVRLPIEYNDIDLCLRLAERGYKSVFEPRARLEHRESASRGANPYLDSRYAHEHSYFRERWGRMLRDDPYFHPALSLDALEIALG
jgi:GT2 family glycosyltransferase